MACMHTDRAAIVCTLVFLASLGGIVAMAAEITLRTDDGPALSLDEPGMVTSLRLDGRELLRQGAYGGLFVADVAGRRGSSPQLLANPGFGELSKARPDGWDLGPEWSVDREAPRSGKTCMKVDVRDAESGSSGTLAAKALGQQP